MQGVFEFDSIPADPPGRTKIADNLYYAVLPDGSTSGRVVRLRDEILSECRADAGLVPEDRLHVSLRSVGTYPRLPERFLFAARRAGNEVIAPPFELVFDAVMSFDNKQRGDTLPRRRPLVLTGGAVGLDDLHATLGSAMRRNGLRASDPFFPHMTLHYGSRLVARRAIEPIQLRVSEFVLVHTEVGLGRRWILGRWPLVG